MENLPNLSSLLRCTTDYFVSFSKPQDESQGWMGYFGQALKTSANYLPTQVTEMFNQGRAFAVSKLPSQGLKNVCAIAT